MPYLMEMFTKSGKPQNQNWDLFSVKNMMLPNLLIRLTFYLYFWLQYFSTGTFAADRDRRGPQTLTKMWFSDVVPQPRLACHSVRHQVPWDMCYPYQKDALFGMGDYLHTPSAWCREPSTQTCLAGDQKAALGSIHELFCLLFMLSVHFCL